MANLPRLAKSGGDWTFLDLAAYNVAVQSQSAQEFFGYQPDKIPENIQPDFLTTTLPLQSKKIIPDTVTHWSLNTYGAPRRTPFSKNRRSLTLPERCFAILGLKNGGPSCYQTWPSLSRSAAVTAKTLSHKPPCPYVKTLPQYSLLFKQILRSPTLTSARRGLSVQTIVHKWVAAPASGHSSDGMESPPFRQEVLKDIEAFRKMMMGFRDLYKGECRCSDYHIVTLYFVVIFIDLFRVC
jgi:hypothetical protein